MGLFSRNYNRPGPGVRADEPRKKGFARLFELLGRDFGSYFKAGFLAFLSALPFILGMAFAIVTHVVLYVLIAGILGGMLAAPQICGMADTILRSLRDEPGYWWTTYRRAWKNNAKASLLPGAIIGLILALQLFTLFHMSSLNGGLFTWVMMILGAFLTIGMACYIFPQITLLDMSFGSILKNSVLLLLGYLPRSAGAIAITLVYWVVMLLFFPLSLFILPFTSFWLPMLPSLLVIYPAFEKSFNLEATISQMREARLNGDPTPIPTTKPAQQTEPETPDEPEEEAEPEEKADSTTQE